MNVLLQNKHRRTASNNSSTTHPRACKGNQVGCSGDDRIDSGRNAFLLHPIHVRTHDVERMNVVIEHRATIIQNHLLQKRRTYSIGGHCCR